MTRPAPAVTIRPATERDVEALVDLDLDSATHHASLDPVFYHVPDRAAVGSFLRHRLTNPNREMLVAEVDGVVVGSVDITAEEPPDPGAVVRPVPTVDIGISVAAGWRGRGIGRRLMEAAEANARERGAERIVLDMSSENVDALRLYRSLGYAEFGLLLRKDLGDGDVR